MKYLLLSLLLFTTSFGFANNDSLRAELSGLLKSRKILFDEYSSALEKKSGFFGNKTKNDLRDSQDKLKEIVEADNKIISSLNRTIDFRQFEKLNLSYDATSYMQRIQNLNALNESLMKQNKIFSDENTAYKAEIKKYRLYNIIVIALILFVGVFIAVRKIFRL